MPEHLPHKPERLGLVYQPNDRLLARLLGITALTVHYGTMTGEAASAEVCTNRLNELSATERRAMREWAANLTGLPSSRITIPGVDFTP
jgi:hypothetical protein